MGLWRCSPSQGKDPSNLLHTYSVLGSGGKWPGSQRAGEDPALHPAAKSDSEHKRLRGWQAKSWMMVLRGQPGSHPG